MPWGRTLSPCTDALATQMLRVLPTASMEQDGTTNRRARFAWRAALPVVVLLLLAPSADRHARAAATLLRFADQRDQALADYRQRAVSSRESTLLGRPLRTYSPEGEPTGHVILAHGMHPLGYDEPRLVSLANAFASSGLVVHTPDQPFLKSLSLDPATATQLAATAHALAERERTGPMGVLGISFAGGLALRAAADDPTAFAFVVPIGAHHNLGRVIQWFAGDAAVGPDGQRVDYPPHPYGVGLLVNAEPERYFPAAEATRAGEVLSDVMHQRFAEAREGLSRLTVDAQRVLQEAREPGRPTFLRDKLLAQLRDGRAQLDAASPAGHLAGVRIPVMILHGAEDPIIPPTEAYYLARELPGDPPTLVSSALRHAETAESSLSEEFALVHFIADVLDAAE